MQLYTQWISKAQQQNDPNGERDLGVPFSAYFCLQCEPCCLAGIDVLGELKYYISGEVYDKWWGRPQTDSLALRAITMIAWAQDLLKTNGTDYVLENLYIADPTKHSVIKSDLEFIAHHWQEVIVALSIVAAAV